MYTTIVSDTKTKKNLVKNFFQENLLAKEFLYDQKKNLEKALASGKDMRYY